jgi:hypothetical protein
LPSSARSQNRTYKCGVGRQFHFTSSTSSPSLTTTDAADKLHCERASQDAPLKEITFSCWVQKLQANKVKKKAKQVSKTPCKHRHTYAHSPTYIRKRIKNEKGKSDATLSALHAFVACECKGGGGNVSLLLFPVLHIVNLTGR